MTEENKKEVKNGIAEINKVKVPVAWLMDFMMVSDDIIKKSFLP